MSCPAITNKGGKLSISRFPVACELTLSELALLDYAVVPGVGSIGDTGIEQDISSYSTTNAGISPQSKAAAVGKVWDVEMLESQSEARDIFEAASAVGNKDTYATRIEWPGGAVEFSIVQVSSPTYVKGAPSGVRIVRYTMIPSFIPIVTNSLPVAFNVVMGGIPFIGETLAATYSYYSPLGLPESGTDYQWYADGVAIPGETSTTLLITGGHIGALITFGVTPSDGLSYGHEAMSVPVGPVADSARFTADAPDLYTDTALTVPVTSYGDAVAGWRGGVLVGVQPTLTARPVYGRMPVSGVRNRMADFGWQNVDIQSGAAGWRFVSGLSGYNGSGNAPVVTPSFGGDPNATRFQFELGGGTQSTDRSGFATSQATIPLGTYTVSCRVRPSGSTTASDIEQALAGQLFSLAAGGSRISQSLIDNGDGTYTTKSTNTGGGAAASIRIQTLGSVGPDTLDFILYNDSFQIEDGLAVTDSQRVAAAQDVTQSGVPDTPILYYDLGDDVLPAAMELPEVTGGTLVIAGEKGMWVDDSFSHAGGSWSLGPTTYTGGPTSLLPNLVGNRVLGFSVFAGQLTAEQLQVEAAYWMGKGAPGVWNKPIGYVMFDDYSQAVDGPLTVAQTGQTWQVAPDAHSPTVVEPFIDSGILKVAPNESGQTATYFSFDAGIAVSEMMAVISFEAGEDGGSAALISTGTGYGVGTGGGAGTGNAVHNITDSSIHIVFTNTYVIVGYFSGGDRSAGGATAGTLTTATNIPYVAPMATDGTTYRVGWRLDGDTLRILMPDGTYRYIVNPALASQNGRYAFFEHYMFDADQCVPQFHQVTVN